MNVHRVDENTITLDLSGLKAQQLEIYCCLPNEDALNGENTNLLKTVNTQQITLSDQGKNSVIISDLEPSTDYIIMACSYENEGEYTELSNYGFILASTQEVLKIDSVQTKMVTNESILVGWDNLSQLGDDALYGGLQYRKKGDSSWSFPQTAVDPSVNCQLITGLSAATTYEIQVVFYSKEGFVRSQSEIIRVETHTSPTIRYQVEEEKLVIYFEGTLYESQDTITWTPVTLSLEQEGIYQVPLSENKQMYYSVRYEF